ncbi:3-methyl-2-oxobutanoate hydroxymethyltransferase [Gleimia hominis]|uniref:3-methyl-2-oxobutanoate hydroxymethyltransferase n=1 Tax=Gleimia hominis TaxID=595468 RepID=A0ABU3IBY6_9ACTO|nr:3-methyl-2-oxobutanoate hydroxymethyltransferase [Gleimia hominis]MDT3767890.1 3-methyl-2-oxobutanoate hydroxymethyltransferase [Gleimia hominis]
MTTNNSDTEISFKEPKRWRVQHVAAAKAAGRKLTMLTSYDALTAPIMEAAGVDMILVGDSYGNVQLGYDTTVKVTLDDMVRATGAVARSVHRPLVVADMPFGTYEGDKYRGFEAAAELMRAGADAVKLEGGVERADVIEQLTTSGIPVCAHLGFTPQSVNTLGGPRMQGRGLGAEKLIADAEAVQEAGAFALVLEMVPDRAAARITRTLRIPTIGIGAGPNTDGQVLVWSDMAGMTAWTPSFVKRFAELGEQLKQAAQAYTQAVKDGSFPAPQHYKSE